ncbi:MAG: hypothetical protein JSS70_06530 [Bacteroidetes bacterium]|nr:hypothetical protein [Bacteroidota bacterium]
MKKNLHTLYFTGIVLLLLAAGSSRAQTFILKGTVYDSSRVYPLEAVSVLTTAGRGAVTNSQGKYEIEVTLKDSIWFSYLNKPTIKYPVARITDFTQFDLSLRVNIPELREVKVMPRNYKLDSIRNRIEYEKIFNFHRPNISSLTTIGPTGAGIDIDELIRVFQFRKNKNTEKFQERLIEQEQDKFVEHRFSKALVRRLTQLDGNALDSFMRMYQPTFEFTAASSDYDFQTYIKEAYEKFKTGKIFHSPFRREDY